MSGWTKKENEGVKLEHFSTASLVKLSVTQPEEVEQNLVIPITKELWLDYSAFESLKEVIRTFIDEEYEESGECFGGCR